MEDAEKRPESEGCSPGSSGIVGGSYAGLEGPSVAMARRDDYELVLENTRIVQEQANGCPYDVQLAPWVGLRDLHEELQELLVAMPRVAGVGHLASGNLRRREQGCGAVPHVVVHLLRDTES
jgi:hypothetical protein